MGTSCTRLQYRGLTDNRHHTLASGTVGEAGGARATATGPLVCYGGCLAPHSLLRGAITPTPRQQGVEEPEHTAPRRAGVGRGR